MSDAFGHVVFTNPERNATVIAGSVVDVTWRDSISHDTLAYHLDFYQDPESPPESLARDIPPDQQSYQWSVPDELCEQCVLVVTQDNSGADYSDRLDLSIALSLDGSAGDSGLGGTGGLTPSGGQSSVGGVGGSVGGSVEPGGGTGGLSSAGGIGGGSGGAEPPLTGGQTASGAAGPVEAGGGGCSWALFPASGRSGSVLLLGLAGAWLLLLGRRASRD